MTHGDAHAYGASPEALALGARTGCGHDDGVVVDDEGFATRVLPVRA